MLSITALYAGLLGLIFIILSYRVVGLRKSESIGIGDGGSDALQLACRVHGNFSEYVPIAVILLAALELNNWSALYIHALGASLVISRVLHAVGYSKTSGASFGRFVGVLLTWIVITALSGLNIYSSVIAL